MVATRDVDSLREASLKYLWMHSRDWVQMAEEGEPVIMVEGKGIEVTDSSGKTWIDTNAGYMSVNVGYGRTEIADAAYEQMHKITFQPPPDIHTIRDKAGPKARRYHAGQPLTGVPRQRRL